MEKDVDYARLVRQAQFGDKDSLERLSGVAARRLRVDLYRLTLRQDLADDVTQETILEMLKVLGKLKEADRFWPWLYRIAMNKLRSHHRNKKYRRAVPLAAANAGQKDDADAMSDLVTSELKHLVVAAMGRLKPEHRTVLTMRCYREMDYSLIAESMGCSELSAKMHFYRAKKALQKELARQGFGKGSLLMALVVFGKLTAPGEAAAGQVSVTAAATKVGVTAGVLGGLTSKTAVLSVVTAGVLGVGTMVATSRLDEPPTASGPQAASDYTIPKALVPSSLAAAEYWYYFPEGPQGPVMARLMQGSRRCLWMQDEQANYYFDRRRNTINISNCRRWNGDLSVWRLPTDDQQLSDFLSSVEGGGLQMGQVSGGGPGLVAVVRPNENGGSVWTTNHWHVLDEEYFRYNWPNGGKTIDRRDAMHKRGWTYFRVEGHADGERVSGTGRLPFVYGTSQVHTPWLGLKVGDRLRLVDNGADAAVYDGAGKVKASYAGGSFFKGLGRPWMGLHMIDTVRRDAAQQRVRFETKYREGEEEAEVILSPAEGQLVYTIDMKNDVVKIIRMSVDEGISGELKFIYLQEVPEQGNEFAEPEIGRYYGSRHETSPGLLWLLSLMNGGNGELSPAVHTDD
jgi:RNA polymerase sigma-70 factor (ECF subfamily)